MSSDPNKPDSQPTFTFQDRENISVEHSDMLRSPEDFKINLTANALVVLKKRYLKRDEEGHIVETPGQLFRRVAQNIASGERRYVTEEESKEWEERFFHTMANLEFLPNSPTLMNAGRELQQLSACFVLPVEDAIDSIFDTIRDTALIHKSGGGTGFSFSRVRPKNDRVKTTNGVASGPVSFMNVFDSATEAIKQGGTRRGANMAILRVDHPDIVDFIQCKDDTNKLKNFNISVGITDAFMEAVKNDSEYSLINPRTGSVTGTLDAQRVFNMIVHQAWKNGEPGMVFLDRMNQENPTPHVGEIEATNPCGEQPLLAYESCNLGSINLATMVEESSEGYEIDYDKLGKTIETGVRFLDDVIEVNNFPLQRIHENTVANRKIGLGVMGFADLLIKLGIKYDSTSGVETGVELMKFIQEKSHEYSRTLAEERGPFPNFKNSKYDAPESKAMRNATVTTIAPTGTLSIIAGCSSGVEPLFSVVYKRRILDGEELFEVHPQFRKMAEEHNIYSKELVQKIYEKGSLKDLDEVPDSIKNIVTTAHDVTPEWHIRMQAAFQKNTDNAVSKTINFATSATEQNVHTSYELAYRLGCKGITVYRDGSRDFQVLSTDDKNRTDGSSESQHAGLTYRPRPKFVSGKTIEMETGCGSLYVTVNEDEKGHPFELFAQIGKAGGCVASQTQSTARLISLALRSGIEPRSIIKHLIGISCHKPKGFGPTKTLSCSDAIGKALQWYINSHKDQRNIDIHYQNERGACPDCGGVIEHIDGCETCRSCGYSECS